jgi:hypothetical protein
VRVQPGEIVEGSRKGVTLKRWGLLAVVAAAAVVFVATGCTKADVDAFIASHTCSIGGKSYVTYEDTSNPGDPVCEDVTSPGSERFPACFQGKTYTFAQLTGESDFSDLQTLAASNTDDRTGKPYKVTQGACSGPAAAGAPQVNDAFLCYSKYQTVPGVWDSDTAAALLKQGYWSPYALPGNVDGGTNIGGFHLACNLTGDQKPTGGLVDDEGTGWTPEYASTPGLYPAAA